MSVECEIFPSINEPGRYDKISYKYTITGRNGASAELINYGARIFRLNVPDNKDGKTADVVLGVKDLDDYLKDGANHGAVVGRSANRIGGAKFTLDGVTYELPVNDDPNNLHTGDKAFQFKFWEGRILDREEADSYIRASGLQGLCDDDSKRPYSDAVLFSCKSEDGENGFPGNLDAEVLYAFLEDDTFLILYKGVSDKKTVFAPTNHAYFNLKGHNRGFIGNEILTVMSDQVTLKDDTNCPDGTYLDVEGTPFDFRNGAPVSQALDLSHPQIGFCKGLDQNFCLTNEGRYEKIAVLQEQEASRTMEVWTDMPGIQFYAGNHLGGDDNKDNSSYRPYDALCLEAQMFPNSVNIPGFASSLIDAGEVKYHACGYRFC